MRISDWSSDVCSSDLPLALALGVPWRFPIEHQDTAVRRPGRRFLHIVRGRQDALARAIGTHHADRELALVLLGKRDQVAAWRPHRRRIAALVEADAMLVRAIGIHHIELLDRKSTRL